MTIENPRTGQTMRFRAGGAERLEIETVNPPTDVPEPEHVHPRQASGTSVTAGALFFAVRGEERLVRAGESITIPANTPHHFWNAGPETAHHVAWFEPALNTQAFFESFFALARAGELDERGMPGLLQLAVMIPVYADTIRVTSPPWAVQRALAALLGPVARRRGLRP